MTRSVSPFDRLLIANRGEIACRIATTARAMGLHITAVFSDVDVAARHVRQCDAAIHIGSANPAESYLNVSRIIEAARRAQADAIHPGYGFLAESADFAEACANAGITFVGPPPAAMRVMATKDTARRWMADAGVPVTQGYDGDDQSDRAFVNAAESIGFPLLVKATAGGGGRGMRLVEQPGALAAGLRAARAEAESAFGDGRLLLERYIAGARHVEVQIVADTHGGIVHLFDRDCSIQRRRQKLLEEAPAPGVPAPVRAAMAEAAITCARAIGYVNAGTVEFLLAPDGTFSFMEMNTRLQVEHPVTEAITGIDLVEWQIRVAAGESLPFGQEQIIANGHAIEARLIAEDPERDFTPQPGPVTLAIWPETTGVRVDTGFDPGDHIPNAYDSLIAKTIVHGADRTTALRAMAQALRGTAIGPGPTTVDLLRRIVDHDQVRAGPVNTDWLELNLPALLTMDRQRLAKAIALATWAVLTPAAANGNPWDRRDGWRLSGRGTFHLDWLTEDGGTTGCDIVYTDQGLIIDLGKGPARLSSGVINATHVRLIRDEQAIAGHVVPHDDSLVVVIEGARLVLTQPVYQTALGAGAGADGRVVAPLPGRVVDCHVSVGQSVKAGDAVIALEAMKMQHALSAAIDGVVEAVNCQSGDQVARGDLLVLIGPARS